MAIVTALALGISIYGVSKCKGEMKLNMGIFAFIGLLETICWLTIFLG